jgi:hypothetical protein
MLIVNSRSMNKGTLTYRILIKKIVMLAICIAATSPLCAQTNPPSDLIILDTAIETNRCYVGEAIPATVSWKIYPPIGLFKAVDIRLPLMESEHFKAYDSHKQADKPNRKSLGIPLSGTRSIANLSTVNHNGHNYTELRMKKVIVPVSAGTRIIPPTTMTCAMKQTGTIKAKGRTIVQGAGSLYQYPLYFDNGFFDKDIEPVDKQLKASSETNILEVLPLPRKAPALFSGLTGQYQFSVTISTNAIRQGDPLLLNLTVASKGYLAHVKFPPLDLQPGLTNNFRVTSDRRLRKINNDNIVFTQAVYPLHHGDQEFPSLSLCYFNPVTKKYETSLSDKISLTVEKANVIDGSSLGLESELPKPKVAFFRWTLTLLAILILSAVIYARYALLDNIPEEEIVDLAEAYNQFRKTLALLKKTDFENARDQHSALNSALSNFFAAHLPTHKPGAITFSDIDQLLIARNADDKLRTKIRTLFREMDMCRFSPATPTISYKQAVAQALEVVEAVSRAVKQ